MKRAIALVALIVSACGGAKAAPDRDAFIGAWRGVGVLTISGDKGGYGTKSAEETLTISPSSMGEGGIWIDIKNLGCGLPATVTSDKTIAATIGERCTSFFDNCSYTYVTSSGSGTRTENTLRIAMAGGLSGWCGLQSMSGQWTLTVDGSKR